MLGSTKLGLVLVLLLTAQSGFAALSDTTANDPAATIMRGPQSASATCPYAHGDSVADQLSNSHAPQTPNSSGSTLSSARVRVTN